MTSLRILLAAGLGVLLAGGCTGQSREAAPVVADVIVIGAGIAGLSAALEAAAEGGRVLVIEANSVGGGHAVMAGGLALVGTPLQHARGYEDSVERAVEDLMAWSPDADRDWVTRYLRASGPKVHDWLAGFGVRFAFILDTPQHTVPRFHFTPRGAVNVVLPLLEAALESPEISFLWSHEASRLLTERGRVTGVEAQSLRDGRLIQLRAPAVIVATGGAQGDLGEVARVWREDVPLPGQMFAGGGAFADGAGHRLAEAAGAYLGRLEWQTIFTNGIPDPRDPAGRRGLLALNPAGIWVNAAGERFINEAGPSKDADRAVLEMTPAMHWLVFDQAGLKELRIRDAIWLTDEVLEREVLGNPALTHRADTLDGLEALAGLPPASLQRTVARYNEQLAAGRDADFSRFGGPRSDPFARPLLEPPFFALARFPLTRKSNGGIAVDAFARAVDSEGRPVPGLYAAGEVTGVAGINGSASGGEGTYLGPAVYMGRLSGRAAMLDQRPTRASSATTAAVDEPVPHYGEALDPVTLSRLVEQPRRGYWHFGKVHQIVLEQRRDCAACHTADWPAAPPAGPAAMLAQLPSCTQCH
ncbi:MAG: FAD-dependent oxidoreductase [Chromatiales bacterium]|nr:FAD-dependent oxidoreductase [Chromatiales bacterium]